METRSLIVNFKNYPEILGERSLQLARAAEEVRSIPGVEIIVAPPAPLLYSIASTVGIPVFSQSVDLAPEGKSTGAILAESIKACGCRGSILNHSESRVGLEVISKTLERMKSLGLRTCVCAVDATEAVELSRFKPEMIAVEPPELIGSGTAVSKARPELISDTAHALDAAGFQGRLLCGAGIVTGEDVEAAVRLGSSGVLVASSIVRAADWKSKIAELASAMSR